MIYIYASLIYYIICQILHLVYFKLVTILNGHNFLNNFICSTAVTQQTIKVMVCN